jgi:hypothetical protein
VHDAPFRHTGEGRYPRLCRAYQEKAWIPAFAGMTGLARIMLQMTQLFRGKP